MPIACPQIAKLCPDGSSVSAQGPNCEFPKCPGVISLAPSGGPVACAQDAKQCSNGSWVVRTGPNCEFVCPNTMVSPALSVTGTPLQNGNDPISLLIQMIKQLLSKLFGL